VLQLTDLHAGYGKLTVLRGINLIIRPGDTVGIFGRNGAGKTTLMNAILNLVHVTSGEIRLEDQRIDRRAPEWIVKRGLSLVPQSRGNFASLTVTENLRLACFGIGVRQNEYRLRLEEVFARFPPLASRRNILASNLSGGEQQMLAISKALMRRPKVLLLDEPSIGLAPRVVEQLGETVRELRGRDLALVITEQNIHWVLELVDHVHILDQGRIVESVTPTGARDEEVQRVIASYLGEIDSAGADGNS
jgi:ABC-type branched-subunit amino acid transport system ATPase component